ncbi:MAG: DJ-1/PfpI family protein [Candidatus Riflebacteria bacterium]|nr:DJ-1/PfpI family protein [Candidatus Riflebacteria bacterium]
MKNLKLLSGLPTLLLAVLLSASAIFPTSLKAVDKLEYDKVKFEEVNSGDPYNVPEVPVQDSKSLEGVKIAIVAAHGFEEIEGTYPIRHMLKRGAKVEIVTPDWIKDRVMAVQFLKPSIWIPVDKQISQAKVEDYDAIIIPGGAWNPIIMRTDASILNFVRKAHQSNKLVASVCHGPQVLINAGLVKGINITGVGDIRNDLRNAGGNVIENQPVVFDHNILTSRDPNDMAQFSSAIEEYLVKRLKFEKVSHSESEVSASTVICDHCHGTGWLEGGPGYYHYQCPTCHGTGRVPGNPIPQNGTDH